MLKVLRRICFLDVDGILNNNLRPNEDLDEENIESLRILSTLVDFEIVLSSSWKLYPIHLPRLRSALQSVGLDFIDTTPNVFGRMRSREIREWLESNAWDEAFILDDLDADWVAPNIENVHFFWIDSKTGLTNNKVFEIAEFLNANKTK